MNKIILKFIIKMHLYSKLITTNIILLLYEYNKYMV